MKYYLPDSYTPRVNNTKYSDGPAAPNYQPYVYRLAHYIASRAGLEWIIDMGSDSAGKSRKRQSINRLDIPDSSELAPETQPGFQFIAHNMDDGPPNFSGDILSKALVVCCDVVEHLMNPEVLMHDLARLSRQVPFLVISTPDRDRVRGWLDNGPPVNPAHVMEWSGTEFVRFMLNCGFKEIPFCGHTINTDFHRVKSTILTLSGTHANIDKLVPLKTIAAIIHGYNEADILPEVFQHLKAQGVDIHYFDNWSEDGSWEIALESVRSGTVAHCQRFPDKPTSQYEFRSQLARTEEHIRNIDADWILHHDSDEIRISPWRGVTIQEALSWIDSIGYNAIDFTVIDFRFLNSTPNLSSPFQQSLVNFEFGRRPGHFLQVKGWKNVGHINLTDSAGHSVSFDGRKVYPLKFLLKHYPLRNQEQANNKVYKHRLPRYAMEKEKYGWHTHYDKFADAKGISGWEFKDLVSWHPVLFDSEYVVERLSSIGLVEP